jgi:hypothetical protein
MEKQGPRGRRGLPGRRGRSGKVGPAGRGKAGAKGEKGARGAVGAVGEVGPTGTASGAEHREILIIERRIEDIYEGLQTQMERAVGIQRQLDELRVALRQLTGLAMRERPAALP